MSYYFLDIQYIKKRSVHIPGLRIQNTHVQDQQMKILGGIRSSGICTGQPA